MDSLIRRMGRSVIEKLWLWRPIVLFAVICIIVFTFVSDEIYSTDLLNALRRNKSISKMEMSIVSDAGVNNITLNNRELLDSINHAFSMAKERKIQLAKVFDTVANIKIFKENHVISLFIKHAVYSGWTITAGSKTLTSDYLFTIVKRYSK